jgi:threonine dehydrogenase-like Zn-dependent dehydrogenase
MVQAIISAISSGTERLIYQGNIPEKLVLDETITSLTGNFNYPFKYGYGMIGQVVALGDNVSTTWQDQLVFAFHPHESHFITTPENLWLLPAGISPDEAVFLPNMETAVNLVMDGQPIIGERVVVFGQGIVGLLTTALLAQFPLSDLVTIDQYAARRVASLAVGAHRTLEPSPQLPEQVRFDNGADLIYELSGNPEALNQAIDMAGFDSQIVIGSWYGFKQATLDLGEKFHRQRIRLISSQVSTINPKFSGRWNNSRRFELAWQMLQKIQPARFISHRFHIGQATQAYQLLDQATEQAMQLILTY